LDTFIHNIFELNYGNDTEDAGGKSRKFNFGHFLTKDYFIGFACFEISSRLLKEFKK